MKDFNMVVIGVGGQGVITTAYLVAEAAVKQGYDVKISELHGLSQRGGSVPCHIRIGKKINSSVIKPGHADLVIALEPLEALRAAKYASKDRTVMIVNTCQVRPVSVLLDGESYPSADEIKDRLKGFVKESIFVDATGIAISNGGSEVMSNAYMIGLASARNLLPVKKELILDAMKESVPEKYFEANKKLFESAD